jgi:hypothetical protein
MEVILGLCVTRIVGIGRSANVHLESLDRWSTDMTDEGQSAKCKQKVDAKLKSSEH